MAVSMSLCKSATGLTLGSSEASEATIVVFEDHAVFPFGGGFHVLLEPSLRIAEYAAFHQVLSQLKSRRPSQLQPPGTYA